MTYADFIPYCGSPPVPGATRWNLDPVLALFFIIVAVTYLAATRRLTNFRVREQVLFGCGLLIAAAALMSPLCSLSVALFSARVTQHMVLTLIAAPLMALGRLDLAIAALTRAAPRQRGHNGIWIGGFVYAIALWTWHLPLPYDATLASNGIYWLMHITTIGAALLLWDGLLRSDDRAMGSTILVGFGTAMQMSLLGAVLTLATRPLFSVHLATTQVWGLSPLEDQQLGGLIMWVPAGLLFTGYALVAFGLWLHRYSGSHASASG